MKLQFFLDFTKADTLLPIELVNSTETCIPTDSIQAIVPSAILKYNGTINQWKGYVYIENYREIGTSNFFIIQLWRQKTKNVYLYHDGWTVNPVNAEVSIEDLPTLDSFVFTVEIENCSVEAGDVIGFYLPPSSSGPIAPLCYNSTSTDTIFYFNSPTTQDSFSLCDASHSRLDNVQVQIEPTYSKLHTVKDYHHNSVVYYNR